MTERESGKPHTTPEKLLAQVAAAGGHLVLDDLAADDLAAWRHAAKVAQLRLWRAGSARLTKWTSGNALRISVIDPAAPPEAKHETKLAERVPESHHRDDFMGRAVRVPSKLPKDLHPVVRQMQQGMARRDAERCLPYHSRSFVPDWIPDVPRQKASRMLRIWQAIVDETVPRLPGSGGRSPQ